MSVDSRFAAPALASLKDCALDDPRLPTPLFVIDSQKLEKNLRRAQDRAAKLGVAFRPHLKTHKSIGIALRQMTTPQGPATVSTLAEARYFGARGVTDLIYAVGIAPQKLAEVSRLRSLGADIKIILDSAEAARAVSAFCSREKTTIPVLLEIDVDGHRSSMSMVTAPVFVLTVQSFCRLRRRSLTEQNSWASSPMPETATNARQLRKSKLPRKPNAPGSFWLQKDCALPAIPSKLSLRVPHRP